ncbi:MAG: MerR family transcriptional regulator [Candidatus Tectomicrobia bacterium]
MANGLDDQQPSDLAHFLATKPFFKIGEVARILGVKPHVLRYWESEFSSLRPKKNPSGQRIYARFDIEALVEIKNLLYNERYTISGAKRMLAQQSEPPPPGVLANDVAFVRSLTQLKAHVHELLTMLEIPKS